MAHNNMWLGIPAWKGILQSEIHMFVCDFMHQIGLNIHLLLMQIYDFICKSTIAKVFTLHKSENILLNFVSHSKYPCNTAVNFLPKIELMLTVLTSEGLFSKKFRFFVIVF
jgi:hypothetical protein